MERPVTRIFMSNLRTFFGAKSFPQINESSYIFTMEALYKNCKISRQYALDGRFSRGTTNCSGYVDTSASELEAFNQHSKSIFNAIPTLEFLAVLVDSQNMTLSLPQEKVKKTKPNERSF